MALLKRVDKEREVVISVVRMLPKGARTVEVKELSQIKMVSGNENKFTKVVHEDKVKQWVGMGWIEERAATASDYASIPVAIEL